jgi:hypothetical protein
MSWIKWDHVSTPDALDFHGLEHSMSHRNGVARATRDPSPVSVSDAPTRSDDVLFKSKLVSRVVHA